MNWLIFFIYSKKSGKVKTAYKREYINAGLDVDLDFAGPTIHGAAVAGYEGWLAGYQMTFDSAKSKMLHSNFAVGYKTGDFQLHTNMYVYIFLYKPFEYTRLPALNPLMLRGLWHAFSSAFSLSAIMDLSLVAPSTRM